MLDILQDAPYSHGRLKEQLDRIKERYNTEADKHLYEELTIIDSKSGALSGTSAILLVVAGIAVDPSYSFAVGSLSLEIIKASFIILFIAVLFGLSVVRLHWFKSEAEATEADLLRLLKIRNGRTRRYRVAWLLTLAGGIAVAAAFVTAELQRIN